MVWGIHIPLQCSESQIWLEGGHDTVSWQICASFSLNLSAYRECVDLQRAKDINWASSQCLHSFVLEAHVFEVLRDDAIIRMSGCSVSCVIEFGKGYFFFFGGLFGAFVWLEVWVFLLEILYILLYKRIYHNLWWLCK